MKLLNRFSILLIIVFCFIILTLSLRGLTGNPTSKELAAPKWELNGPFELSPERGRFILTYSILENKSFQFSDNLANFASPDVAVTKDGKYASLFAPLVSFITIPGYIIGRYLGTSQVGVFAVIAIFALLNTILLRQIAVKLGANNFAATIASVVFIFGTPAFAYAVNLYQHHMSTFLILLSIYALLKTEKFWSFLIVFFLCAVAIPLDYPNLFFMLPIGVFALGRIISFKSKKSKLLIKTNLLKILTPAIMIIPILFFLWFNTVSFGNPFQLSGTLKTIQDVNKKLISKSSIERFQPSLEKTSGNKKTAIGFFKTRNILNGLYIHFVSPDRGIIYYTPVVLFGVIGFLLALKKKVQMTPLLTAIFGANVLLYSMWGDPYGGWAFGSRYLIPSYAILSIFIALLITYWRKKVLFWTVFIFVSFYSIAVNTLGAITTSAIPPKVEVLNLEKLSGHVQKYTYERNWDLLVAGHSKSFIYQTFAKDYLTSIQYYQIIVVSIFLVMGGLILYYIAFGKDKND